MILVVKSALGLGWNNAPLYDAKGDKMNIKNNSSEWIKFKKRLI